MLLYLTMKLVGFMGHNKWSIEDVVVETQGGRWTLETSGNGPKKGNPLHLNMETTQKK